MQNQPTTIRRQLEEHPDCVYVAPTGQELYFLDGVGDVCVISGENLQLMNAGQINKFFQENLHKAV